MKGRWRGAYGIDLIFLEKNLWACHSEVWYSDFWNDLDHGGPISGRSPKIEFWNPFYETIWPRNAEKWTCAYRCIWSKNDENVDFRRKMVKICAKLLIFQQLFIVESRLLEKIPRGDPESRSFGEQNVCFPRQFSRLDEIVENCFFFWAKPLQS